MRAIVVLAVASTAIACTRATDPLGAPQHTTTSLVAGVPGDASTVVSDASPAISGPASDAEPLPPADATIPNVPETGVPGLDSDDAFCAAWSRFGGSWQVVLVASTFGTDPTAVARYEVIASTVVADAYDDLFAAWPEELDDEREVVAESFFGPFQRRSADAAAALAESGATAGQVATLAEAWVDALATRDPTVPDLSVELPADVGAVVTIAAETFVARRVPLQTDPSMVITAATPLTDEYLQRACPDQGSIFGQDVVG